MNEPMTSVASLLRNRSGEIEHTKAHESAAQVHISDKAAEIAKRIKDARGLEKALLGKLEGQRDFAAEYKAKFPHGGDRGANQHKRWQDDSAVVLADPATVYCQSFGFHLRAVQRWCELLEASVFNAKKNAILDKCWKLAELWQAVNYSSESVEWYTPARYLEAVHEVLGGIDLDPASNELANSTVRATAYFTDEQDGLQQKWTGRVFMNPPYGKTDDGDSMAGTFCKKAVEEYESGNVKACIILVNSSHSQDWQAPLYNYPVCFVDHRIQFVSGDGQKNKNPTFQNIFVYLGVERERFATVFSRFGYVMERIHG